MVTTVAALPPETAAPDLRREERWSASLADIGKAEYLSLTTFRRSGAPVVTPVWFARVGQALYVITDDDTGKVKRIRRNPAVRVAACTARGKSIGASIDAVVHLHTLSKTSDGKHALYAKYGWLFGAFELVHRVQRKTPVLLEIVQPESDHLNQCLPHDLTA
jgi:PPOX class probable F420-dependent enzyme